MKALILLLSAVVLVGCNDDDGQVRIASDSQSEATDTSSDFAEPSAEIELPPRTISYLSGERWDGWEHYPERVQVQVRSDEETHTHYFESLPVAYGWLDDYYEEYEIEELLIASALEHSDLLDARAAYFLLSAGDGDRLPLIRAYPSRRAADYHLRSHGDDGLRLVAWQDLNDGLYDWRDAHWQAWRDDFGFTRSPAVTRFDGERWDGWYDSPDRVLVKVRADGGVTTHYFDALPVAWAWLDDRYDNYELIELQVASALTGVDLLDARKATYVWLPGSDDVLPLALAFATRELARDYLDYLGDDDFRLAQWDEVTPRLSDWREDHWHNWRDGSRHSRGPARALESGEVLRSVLVDGGAGVVAGRSGQRMRSSEARDGDAQRFERREDRGRDGRGKDDRDKGRGRRDHEDGDRGRDKGKDPDRDDRDRGRDRGKDRDRDDRGRGGGRDRDRDGDDRDRARSRDRDRDNEGKGRDKGRGRGSDRGKGSGRDKDKGRGRGRGKD